MNLHVFCHLSINFETGFQKILPILLLIIRVTNSLDPYDRPNVLSSRHQKF